MATIIAGLFETIAEAEKAEVELKNGAFDKSDVSVFALNPPGQHALYPVGGDQYADPGADEADTGAATGAALGGTMAAMAATGAGLVVAAAAAAVGAYTGSLVGALNKLGDQSDEAQPAAPIERHAGVMVAIKTDDAQKQEQAITLLRVHGAQAIEKADGEWRNGQWVDFDPRKPPVLVTAPRPTAGTKLER